MERTTILQAAAAEVPGIDSYSASEGHYTPVSVVTARPGNFWSGLNAPYKVSRAGSRAPEVFAEIAAEVTRKAHDFAEREGIDIPAYSPSHVVGTLEVMFPRVGVGAFGEARYIGMLEAAGETVKPQKSGDEDAGIDIRTDRATYQVKATSRNPLKDGERDALQGEADHLIWVKPDGEVVEL